MSEDSKKIQEHYGEGDNVAGDKITNIYLNTKDYQELDTQLTELRERKSKLLEKIKRYPNDDDFKTELLTVDAKVTEQEEKIESFKKDVYRLYETFTKIKIDKERLKLAKERVEKGAFREADAILKTEEISEDVEQLKQAKREEVKRSENKLREIDDDLKNKANEFLIKAQLWQTFYEDPDWFEKTCEFFEKAMDAYRDDNILFEYAVFLQNQNQFNRAYHLYEEALKIRRELFRKRPRIYSADLALTLNNLANLQKNRNDFSDALEKYEEALKIRRRLSEENPEIHSQGVVETLNNIANLHRKKGEYSKAINEFEEALEMSRTFVIDNPKIYQPLIAGTLNNLGSFYGRIKKLDMAFKRLEEALSIYKELAKENPEKYFPDVSLILMNLGNFYMFKKEFSDAFEKYEEALKIRRNLSKVSPKAYLPDLADTLKNLAILQYKRSEFSSALENYKEALKIYRNFSNENSRVYLPDLTSTLVNLSILYLDSVPDKEKSIEYAKEAFQILFAYNYKGIPQLEQYFETAKQVLEANGVVIKDLLDGE